MRALRALLPASLLLFVLAAPAQAATFHVDTLLDGGDNTQPETGSVPPAAATAPSAPPSNRRMPVQRPTRSSWAPAPFAHLVGVREQQRRDHPGRGRRSDHDPPDHGRRARAGHSELDVGDSRPGPDGRVPRPRRRGRVRGRERRELGSHGAGVDRRQRGVRGRGSQSLRWRGRQDRIGPAHDPLEHGARQPRRRDRPHRGGHRLRRRHLPRRRSPQRRQHDDREQRGRGARAFGRGVWRRHQLERGRDSAEQCDGGRQYREWKQW